MRDSEVKCALPSCFQPKPGLYDEQTELCFCDLKCFTEYFVEEPGQFVSWYAGMNLHGIDY